MSALKSFKQWVYLMQQIHEAKFYIGRAEELGHPHLLKSYNDILEFLAHFRAASILTQSVSLALAQDGNAFKAPLFLAAIRRA